MGVYDVCWCGVQGLQVLDGQVLDGWWLDDHLWLFGTRSGDWSYEWMASLN
jgi:hypothetical protein